MVNLGTSRTANCKPKAHTNWINTLTVVMTYDASRLGICIYLALQDELLHSPRLYHLCFCCHSMTSCQGNSRYRGAGSPVEVWKMRLAGVAGAATSWHARHVRLHGDSFYYCLHHKSCPLPSSRMCSVRSPLHNKHKSRGQASPS